MSMDFAVIPVERFETAEEALTLAESIDDDQNVTESADTRIADLFDDLDRIGADEDDGFLSIWPIDATPSGVVLCTRWNKWATTPYTLLELTKDRGLALVDYQRNQVFDPRGRVDVHVETANRATLPYLTDTILADIMDRQDFYGDHVVVERVEQHYVQALYQADRLCAVEYRDGGPDRHYRVLTPQRATVRELVWAWALDGPAHPTLQAQQWDHITL